MPEKSKVHTAPTAMPPKGHMALKSSALCTTDCKLVSQLLVQERMAAHYKKLSKVKAAVDTTPPKTWSGSQKVRDQARREALKQGGKGAISSRKNNFGRIYSPLNTSRTSSDAARDEMMAMLESLNDEDFPDGMIPRAARRNRDGSTLEVNPPGSSVNLSLDDVDNMHTMAQYRSVPSRQTAYQRSRSVEPPMFSRTVRGNSSARYPVAYHSFDETTRGNVTRRNGTNAMHVTRSGDILESHTERFTDRKPFTPKTLKTNSKSKLLEFKYYNRPPPKKEVNRDKEDDLNRTSVSNAALGRTMYYPRNKPVPQMTTESDLMNETLQSRADHEVTPTGVPPLNISLDPDHINWLQEQSRKSSSRRGHESHVDMTSDLGTTHRTSHRFPNYKKQDLNTTQAGNNTITLERVQESGEDDLKYLEFVSDVTNDVLDRGIFTNRALQQVFETHLQRNKNKLDVKRMRTLLEDLRIDLGIPAERTDVAFGGTTDYEKDKDITTRDAPFGYKRESVDRVIPLERSPTLDDYREDDLHAFKPISRHEVTSDSKDYSVKSNTPVSSEAHTNGEKSSHHSDQPEQHNFQSGLKSSQGSSQLEKTGDVENFPSEHDDDRASEVFSDVTAVSSRPSLGKTTMKFSNTKYAPSKFEDGDRYEEFDSPHKSDYDYDGNKHDDETTTQDDYDVKYDDDDYEVETSRTGNEGDNDYETIKNNYEDIIERGSASEQSETDVYGQSEIESTKEMKPDSKNDDEK